MVEPRTQVIVAQPGGFSRFVHWLGWVGFGLAVMLLVSLFAGRSEYYDTSHDVSEKFYSGAEFGSDKIAVIRLEGLIAEGEGFAWRQIQRVRDDDSVKAVVVRINSPGGSVTGSDFLLHHLRRLRDEKQVPLVVSMGAMAASGGYYAAMAVGDQPDSIFAEPTTTTGSIGVVLPHYDVTQLMEVWGVKDDSIATHPRKLMLSMTRTMEEEERRLAESYVQESLERFREVIFQGRPKFRELGAIEHEGVNLATGEIFSANKAVEFGLVDKIGFLEDAVERARELAALSADSVRVVEYQRVASLLDFGGVTAEAPAAGFWVAPRGYYLSTTDPIGLGMLAELLRQASQAR